MDKNLNRDYNTNIGLHTFAKFILLIISLVACAISVNAQTNNETNSEASTPTNTLKMKSKDINNESYPYLKIGGEGIYPCGERFSISLEDEARFIFSAASGFNVTLSPNGEDLELDGLPFGGGGKRATEAISYQQSFDRIKNLNIGYTEGTNGKKWGISFDQLKAFYPDNVFDITYKGKERTAFDQSNLFYEMLISVQVLSNKNEEQQIFIEQQTATIERLSERLEQIEKSLNIDAEISVNRTLGEVTISPNPIKDGILRVAYQLNEHSQNMVLTITDVQGKKVYRNTISPNQKIGLQNLNINLPPGTYLYYLKNSNAQTNVKKLIIQ